MELRDTTTVILERWVEIRDRIRKLAAEVQAVSGESAKARADRPSEWTREEAPSARQFAGFQQDSLAGGKSRAID
jgi:hypothetical protein